jgi:hypothetical protein
MGIFADSTHVESVQGNESIQCLEKLSDFQTSNSPFSNSYTASHRFVSCRVTNNSSQIIILSRSY